jgi:protein phosphatase
MKYKLYLPQAINEMGNRKNQEDTIFPVLGEATADSRLFIVCDGMGGYEKGEVASDTVARAISDYLLRHCNLDEPLSDHAFGAALAAAFDALDEADPQRQNLMGTTLTMLCFHRGGCLAAHIGDSRIYHLRPATGDILYRSRDHSLVQQLYEMGEISYHQMKTSPKKNVVTRAMQPHQDTRSKADLVHITDIRPGDYFYMCTDGMLELMEDEELMRIVGDKNTTDEQKKQQLIEATQHNSDNHSAYLIHIERVENEENDSLQLNDEAQARAANKALNDPFKDQIEEMEEEPAVTTIRQGTQQSQPTQRPQQAQQAPRRRPAPKKSSGGKKLLVPLIIVLVAILTGFTLFNLLGQKKDVPPKTPDTEITDDNNNQDRVEFQKDDLKEKSGSSDYFPANKGKTKGKSETRDKQTDDVNDIIKNSKQRDDEKKRAEKEKAEKEEKAQYEKEKEETKQKAQQAKEQADKVLEKAKKPKQETPQSDKTIHIGNDGSVKVENKTEGQ